MVSLALVDDHAYSPHSALAVERPIRREAREGRVRESTGEIGRLLHRLSRVHLRAALHQIRFSGWLGHGRITDIAERLACLGAVERLTDGSFALLDISPTAAMAEAGDAKAKLRADVAHCFGGRGLDEVEIVTRRFWTDEMAPEELLVAHLQ